MAYAKGTATPVRRHTGINPARVGVGKPVATNVRTVLPVRRKPAKNKAAK
jgi:hypothetical protein